MRAHPEPGPRRSLRLRRFVTANLGFLLGAVAGVRATLAVLRLSGPDEPADLAHYREVRDFARSSFVREVDEDELLERALEGMLSSLDEYSRYYDTVDARSLDRETVGRYTGIGIVLKRPLEEGRILFPLVGSPAQRAGVRVGDTIVRVDLREVAPNGFTTELLHGAGDSAADLRLSVVGLDGDRRELVVERASLVDPTVRHAQIIEPEDGIAYVSVNSFSRTTPREFEDAMSRLHQQGARALILDLRGNFGGVLSAAVELAARFVKKGTIVSTEGRGPAEVYVSSEQLATLAGLPLVVLVDGNSASASEVLAAAIQDHRVGVVIGAPTYGKGLVQTIRSFKERRTIAKVTSAYYYTPSHRNLERSLDPGRDYGILPDIAVELSRAERSALYEFLVGYGPPEEYLPALRDWERESGEEILPRQPRDAQLEAAIALLRGERPGPTPLAEEREP